ncbi:PASTA domain-containing protein [Streptosporangium sp. NPDC050855]|uniref:PASTA domain-containing protein n=1 Tax=Streptosporangium sp. NPDC050855 TaxID=3366194 RepID=UPI0037A98E38
MARKSSSNLLAPVIVVLLIVGGCTQLVKKVFGTDDPEPAQAAQAAAGPVTVPNLVKKKVLHAKHATKALGLILSTAGITGSSCDEEADCLIYRMEPKAGTVVKAGAEVDVKFVTSEEWDFYKKHRKMPNVIGWSDGKVESFFKKIRDGVWKEQKESAQVPPGAQRVIKQSPKPGRPLRVGQKIDLVIAYNPDSPTSVGDGGTDLDFNGPNRNRRGGGGGFCRSKWC